MTSKNDDFLILCAAIRLDERDIPIYFTMRNYPKRKNAIDYRKMEEAFLRGLMHCLSKKYQYVIIADRGFGNQRIMNLCEELGFEYVIGIEPNMKIEYGTRIGLTNEVLDKDGSYAIKVVN